MDHEALRDNFVSPVCGGAIHIDTLIYTQIHRYKSFWKKLIARKCNLSVMFVEVIGGARHVSHAKRNSISYLP